MNPLSMSILVLKSGVISQNHVSMPESAINILEQSKEKTSHRILNAKKVYNSTTIYSMNQYRNRNTTDNSVHHLIFTSFRVNEIISEFAHTCDQVFFHLFVELGEKFSSHR